jgi:hypothetical protein
LSARYALCPLRHTATTPGALPSTQQLPKIALQPLFIAKKTIIFGDLYLIFKKRPKNLHPLKMRANFGPAYQQIEKPAPSCLFSVRTFPM